MASIIIDSSSSSSPVLVLQYVHENSPPSITVSPDCVLFGNREISPQKCSIHSTYGHGYGLGFGLGHGLDVSRVVRNRSLSSNSKVGVTQQGKVKSSPNKEVINSSSWQKNFHHMQPFPNYITITWHSFLHCILHNICLAGLEWIIRRWPVWEL